MQFIAFLAMAALLLGIMAIYGTIKEKKKEREIREEQEAQEYATTTIDFYNLCKSNGVTSFPLSSYQMEKVQEIAARNGMDISSSVSYYYAGYGKVKSLLREEESALKDNINIQIELPGCSKYIQGLLSAFEEDYARYLNLYKTSSNIVQKQTHTYAHTHSWATAGGFAEAIGGVGLGVATALKVQADNAKAEASARAKREEAYKALYSAQEGDEELNKRIEALVNAFVKFDKYLNKAEKTTITQNQFIIKNQQIKESGSLYLTISPKAKEINKQKMLDGIVYIKVIKDNTVVGGGYMTSPG